ncbi:MAG: hypothetical protein ABWY64_07495, partial [Tardiphaga sp.]
MPRLPTGVYEQPFPDVIPDTTIESAVYNGFVNDIETDLNTPRPIVAGGTGATSAAGALTSLGAVAKAGDTMTGNLTLDYAGPSLRLRESDAPADNRMIAIMQPSADGRLRIAALNDAGVGGAAS